jgi:hypothetical protein
MQSPLEYETEDCREVCNDCSDSPVSAELSISCKKKTAAWQRKSWGRPFPWSHCFLHVVYVEGRHPDFIMELILVKLARYNIEYA